MPPRHGVQLFSASVDSIAIPLLESRAGLDGGGATVPYWPRFAIGCDAARAPGYQTNAEIMRLKPPRLTARLCLAVLLLLSGGPPASAAKGGASAGAANTVPGWHAVLVAADNAEPVFDNAVETIARQLAEREVPAGNIHRLSASDEPRDP